MAVWNRQPGEGVIHHSDHGSQYTSLLFGEHCQAVGIQCSMGSVGDCYDNAMAESFFATLECELLARQPFPTQLAACTALFEYLEVFYNRQRRHSALGYLSPVAYESRMNGGGLLTQRLLPNAQQSIEAGQLQPITIHV
jgi:putative transposase